MVRVHGKEMSEKAERLRERHREKKRRENHIYHVKSLYGISRKEVEEMKAWQGYRCAICGEILHDHEDRKTDFNIDHNHDTGEVRGLLCTRCNLLVGRIENGTLGPKSSQDENLEAAWEYVRANGTNIC